MSANVLPPAEQTNVITFPVSTACPACKRVCSEEDLNECNTCEGKFCGHTTCTLECRCTRFIEHVVIPRLQRMQRSAWRRAWDYIREWL